MISLNFVSQPLEAIPINCTNFSVAAEQGPLLQHVSSKCMEWFSSHRCWLQVTAVI